MVDISNIQKPVKNTIKMSLCCLEISNIESLNVKYNLNHKINKIQINPPAYPIPPKMFVIKNNFSFSEHVILMILSMLLVMLVMNAKRSVIKYMILIRISMLLWTDNCLIDIIKITFRMIKTVGYKNVPAVMIPLQLVDMTSCVKILDFGEVVSKRNIQSMYMYN